VAAASKGIRAADRVDIIHDGVLKQMAAKPAQW
jgi:hypothetical protein